MDPEKYLILAYLEEDNVQRAFFRVKPMLTAEGIIHEEAEQKWPNEGCLRIVPDKNEHHTFKDRMRSMGHWCMLDLTGFSSETNKIRSNKNFHPDRGEVNQFILYSDAVKAVPDFLFYEILEGTAEQYAELAGKAVTPKFYIRQEDALYGPVMKSAPTQPDPAAPGEAVLYPVAGLDGVEHIILCIPSENRITERPVRGAKNTKHQVVEPAKTEETPVQDAAVAADTPAAQPADQPADAAAEEAPKSPEAPAEEALPVGKPLKILNEEHTFEETLQNISQPLSADANLLRGGSSMTEASQKAAPVLTGTPLTHRSNLHASVPQPKNKLQEFVASQCRVARNDPPADPLPEGAELKSVQNPVEDVCSALRKVWQTPETHSQLVNCILSIDGMKNALYAANHGADRATPLVSASRRYLQDLEAERLVALVELDKAKADTEEFRRACVGESNNRVKKQMEDLQKKLDEITASTECVKEQINTLTATRDVLQNEVDAIRHGTLPASIAKLIAEGGLAAPVTAMPLRLNPVVGGKASLDDMLHRIELACRACGVSYDKNRVIAFLVLLAVCPRIGVAVNASAPAVTLATNLACAMGWQSSFAHQSTAEEKSVVSAAPADGTPAILLTSLSMYTVISGMNKLLLGRSAAQMTRNVAYEADPWPIYPVQQLSFIPAEAIAPGDPISAASLAELCSVHPADPETVGMALKPIMEQTTTLSGLAYRNMVRFTSACAGLMEGGLAAACDWAVLLWLIPAADRRNMAALTELLQEYPLSTAALNSKN